MQQARRRVFEPARVRDGGFRFPAAYNDSRLPILQGAKVKPSDISIDEVSYALEDFLYRTPIKFGGIAVDRATLVNVTIRVQSGSGKTAQGFGSMPLGNVWSFPSRTLSYEQTLAAMKTLVERIARITGACKESGQPIELTHALEPSYVAAAREVGQISNLPE